MGDNARAINWIIRSLLPKSSVYKMAVHFIARKVATLVSGSQNFIVPTHLPGIMNSITDWQSFQGEENIKHGTRKPVFNPLAYDYPPNDVFFT